MTMPHDTTHTGLGFELALLRALGEIYRRHSLADRLVRERRVADRLPEVRVGQIIPKAPPLSRSPTEP